ncbi:MAG: homoserine kinase [Thalassotalea sp.]
MTLSIFAPASIGNVSVGFDILGMAVKPVDGTLLGDVVTIEAAAQDGLAVVGAFANKLPSNPKENIVWQCIGLYNKYLAQISKTAQPVLLTLDKKMPVGSGLGSSACSVVAALHALNEFYNKPFDEMSMLKMMGEMEAQISGSLHYDNVAPCYLGGLQLMLPDADNVTRTLPGFKDYYYIMAYPGIEVSTKAAREVLPANYSRADLITFGQNLAAFVDACHRQDAEQAFASFTDVVAEPFRSHLLPGFEAARTHLLSEGSVAVGISGSGPTLFAICKDLDNAQAQAQWLQTHYVQNELGFVHVCHLDEQGAIVLPGA